MSDDDGYISPEFDLPDIPSGEEEEDMPPPKRNKLSSQIKDTRRSRNGNDFEDDEELALRLLRRQ